MNKIYAITIFQNGKFTWKTSSRDKTIEDYQRQQNWQLVWVAVLVGSIICKGI